MNYGLQYAIATGKRLSLSLSLSLQVLPRCADVTLGSVFGPFDDRWHVSQHDSVRG